MDRHIAMTMDPRYYARLIERIVTLGEVHYRTRLVCFTSLHNWPEALARNINAAEVSSLRFTPDYRRPAGEEAELFR
jgi:hypothetical protein